MNTVMMDMEKKQKDQYHSIVPAEVSRGECNSKENLLVNFNSLLPKGKEKCSTIVHPETEVKRGITSRG